MELVKCQICNASTKKAKQVLTDDEKNALLKSIYRGITTVRNLPKDVYLKFDAELKDAAKKGYPEENERLDNMNANITHFAAAKTYQMVRLVEQERQHKGRPVAFEAFTEAAIGILIDFSGSYLVAEKDQSHYVGKAMKVYDKRGNSEVWEYVTMRDNAVRPAHVYLDGLIFDSDNKEMAQFSPPNGWNCRCKKRYLKKGVPTDLKDFDMEEAHYNIPPMFRRDFGDEGIAFPKDHPYFSVPRKDKDLPKRNFGLPDVN